MKYVTYFKNNLMVDRIYDKKPLALTDNLGVAQCENIITAPQYGYLRVKNLETVKEPYIVNVEVLDEKTKEPRIDKETGKIKTIEETRYREYQVCELEAVENPNKEKIIQIQEIKKQIQEKKKLLEKYKFDIQQVDLFGMERTDYEEKKSLCVQLVLELRELENSLKA